MAIPVGAALQVFAQLWYGQPELAAGAYAVGAIAATVPRCVPTFDQTKSWFQRDARSSTHVGIPIVSGTTDKVWIPEQDTMSYPTITFARSRPTSPNPPANYERQSKSQKHADYSSSRATASSPEKKSSFSESTSKSSTSESSTEESESSSIDPDASMGPIESKPAVTCPIGILGFPTAVDVARNTTSARDLTEVAEDHSSAPGHSTSNHGPTPSSAVTPEPTRSDPDQEDTIPPEFVDEYGNLKMYPVVEQLLRAKMSVVYAAVVAYAMQYHAPWLIFKNYCSDLNDNSTKAMLLIKLIMSTLLQHMPGSLSELLGKPHANHFLTGRAMFAVLIGVVLSVPCIFDAVASHLRICGTARHPRHLHPWLANLNPRLRILLFGLNRLTDCCAIYFSSYTQDLVVVFATEALVFTFCWLYINKEFLSMYARQALGMAIIRTHKVYTALLRLSRFIRRFSSIFAFLALMPIAIYVTIDPEQVHKCLEQFSENNPLPPSHDYIYYILMIFVVVAFLRPIVDTTVFVWQFFVDVYKHVRLHASGEGAPARPTTYIGYIKWLPEISRFCLFKTHDAVMILLSLFEGTSVMVVAAWLITIYTIPLWLVLLMKLRDIPGYMDTSKHWIASKTKSPGSPVDLVANPNKHVMSRALASSSAAVNTLLSHVGREGETLLFSFSDCAKPALAFFAQSCRDNWCGVLAWRWLWRTPTIIISAGLFTVLYILAVKSFPRKDMHPFISVSVGIAFPYTMYFTKPVGGLECTQDYINILTTVVIILLLLYLWGQVPIEMRATFEEVSAGFPGGVAQLFKPTKKKLPTPRTPQPAKNVSRQEGLAQARLHWSPLSLSTVTTITQQEPLEPHGQQEPESHPGQESSPEIPPLPSPPHQIINILLFLSQLILQWWTELPTALAASDEAGAAAEAAREQVERERAAQSARVEQRQNTASSRQEEQEELERELSGVPVQTAPKTSTQPIGPIPRRWRPYEPIPFNVEEFLPYGRRAPLTDLVDSHTAEEKDELPEVEKEPDTLTTTLKLDTPPMPSILQQPSATAHPEPQNDNVEAPTSTPDPPSNTGF